MNGIIYNESVSKLPEIFVELCENDAQVNSMIINAQNYYFKEPTIEGMVSGLKHSVGYAIKNKIFFLN